jgi:hypothetical protein
MKLSARAAEPIAAGADVVITHSLSATAVRVQAQPA